MELKKGYKQTEVGLIPEDWKVHPLGSVLSVRHGKSQHNVASESGEFPILATGGEIGRASTYLYNKPSVLIGRKGTIDKPRFMSTPFWTVDTLFYTELAEHIDSKFIYYKFCLIDWYAYNEASGVPSLNAATIEKILQAIPTKKTEQTAIAKTLSDIDALITQLEKLITKKRQIKQGAMQTLLNPFDKNGELKDGWERKTVFELADCKKELFDDGDWIEAKHITDKGVRLVQTGNIGIGRFNDKNTKKYIFESSFSQLKCKELQAGDLLICRLAEPAGRACIFPLLDDKKVVTSVDVTIFRPRNDIANRVYLSNVFSTAEWFSMINESVGGTTHKRISRGSLGKIAIFLPPIDEQNTVASILFDMDTEITALETKLVKTRQLKQGMMQSLLTGQIRLVAPN